MRRTFVFALGMVLFACSPATEGPPTVSMSEFDIDVGGTWTSGRNVIVVGNHGEFAHTIVATDASGVVVAATELVAPGSVTDLEVELPPGRYQLTCRIVVEADGEVIDHYERGMAVAVEVGA